MVRSSTVVEVDDGGSMVLVLRVDDSGLENYDALFTAQQHLARDLQDTFFLKVPSTRKTFLEDYVESVKTMHESRGHGLTTEVPERPPEQSRRYLRKTFRYSSELHALRGTLGDNIGSTPAGIIESTFRGPLEVNVETPRTGTNPPARKQIEGYLSAIRSLLKKHNERGNVSPIHLSFDDVEDRARVRTVVTGKEIGDADLKRPFKEAVKTH
ncbi:reverse transcriptase domain-containing protein [Tanacetum coccineum]